MENKKVFHVTRSTKTGKSVDIGDFDTVEQAQEAMLKHYRETPKRGQFCYQIVEEELKEIGGVMCRQFCLVIAGGNRPYKMKIYLLIHEQDTDAAWGCDVKPFTDKHAAMDAMRSDWQETSKYWEYDYKEHKDEDECECGDDTAIIRDGDDVENWRIEEHELDVQVAVEVIGGIVLNIYANVDVRSNVYGLDVSDFPYDGEEAELNDLVKSPGWRNVW